MISQIEEHILGDGKVFVGTDSQLSGSSCIFVTAICLHGNGPMKGRYYFTRSKERSPINKELRVRITAEVERSVDIGLSLIDMFPDADIEIHIDIGSTQKSKTRHLVDVMTGWAKSAGFKCMIKPNAWASASIADKHTK
tara:strand:- start:4846 stop:5262 length:417 start_codon:yes stop_codon:yes gene_type:complete